MKMREGWNKITTIDMHTGGEPLRIYTGGLPDIEGNTILEKRKFFRDHFDYIRTATLWEPRGHADMYGAVVTEAVNEGSDFGTFFLHNEGYSTMCGHAIIALTKYMLEMGLLNKTEPDPELRIDAPAGLITARAFRDQQKVYRVSFRNVPSFVFMQDEKIEVEGLGRISFDVAYGGAFYAILEASQIGIGLETSDLNDLISAGRKIKNAIMEKHPIIHPFEDDLGFLYGVILTASAEDKDNHSRNVCIFADGEVDRSATGTGVSARAALHYNRGELKKGEKITIESIVGSTMDVEVAETLKYGPHDAIIPEVSGSAFFTGRNEFWFDPEDPLKNGIILR
jgi:trans-L-3-hydroxyproline dehydratase